MEKTNEEVAICSKCGQPIPNQKEDVRNRELGASVFTLFKTASKGCLVE